MGGAASRTPVSGARRVFGSVATGAGICLILSQIQELEPGSSGIIAVLRMCGRLGRGSDEDPQ